MARIRTIKPEFFRHEALQDLEIANPGSYAMLTFAGLWGHCDNKGRFEWRPRLLKLDILPFLSFDMGETLEILEQVGMVTRYTVDGKEYGLIPSFVTHQRITGKEAADGEKYPEPPGETTGKQQGNTGERQDAQEGKGREEEREGNGVVAPPDQQKNATTRAGALCKQLRKMGIDAAPHLPAWADLLERFTDEQIIAVAETAKERKPNERLHLHYLIPILTEPPRAPPAARRAPAAENFDKRDYGQGGRL